MNRKKTNYTKLEKSVFRHPEWKKLSADAEKQDRQKVLDAICNEVVGSLSSEELCQSMTEIYSTTVPDYQNNPHINGIIDDLIKFMDMLSDGVAVLDIGCGHGRDALFMAINDKEFRKSLMSRIKDGKTTADRYPIPEKTFKAVGIDGAPEMIKTAREWADNLEETHPQIYEYPYFYIMDIHNIRTDRLLRFDGIWSCTALFTHTPHEFLDSTMKTISNLLYAGGIFFTSYTKSRAGEGYNKLILSSTGRIKWFSQPDPDEIIILAKKYGLDLMEKSTYDDYKKGSDFKKDLFVSHFFQKRE